MHFPETKVLMVELAVTAAMCGLVVNLSMARMVKVSMDTLVDLRFPALNAGLLNGLRLVAAAALLPTQTAVTQGKSLTTNTHMVATALMLGLPFQPLKSTAVVVTVVMAAAAVAAVALKLAKLVKAALLQRTLNVLVTVVLARLEARAIPDALSFTTKAVSKCL